MRLLPCLLAVASVATAVWAQDVQVPNASFEEGAASPDGWRLSRAPGRWASEGAAAGARHIAVRGDGTADNHWLSDPIPLKPLSLYELTFQCRGIGASGGTPVTGPPFCNRDIGDAPAEWARFSSVFATPAELGPDRARLRFGQWKVKGTVCFDDVSLRAVQPVDAVRDGLRLGEGEALRANDYRFSAPFSSHCRNYSRPLVRATCDFNTDRWVFGRDGEVVYRHELAERAVAKAEVEASVVWHRAGALAVEVSTNGVAWRSVGRQEEVGTVHVPVPDDLLPAKALWVRLRPGPDQGQTPSPPAFQVGGYGVQATVTGKPVRMRGHTRFVHTLRSDPQFTASLADLGEALPGGRNQAVAYVVNHGPSVVSVTPSVALVKAAGARREFRGEPVRLDLGTNRVCCAYDVPSTGTWSLRFALDDRLKLATSVRVPSYYDTSYGELLPGSNASLDVWWASSGWKVPRTRSLPTTRGNALRIAAAGNEAEAAQLVLRPRRDLKAVTVRASDLASRRGTRISASQIDVLRVAYVPVDLPTDATGVAAPWPDPLPPIHAPLDLAAGVNQPLWVRARVPAGTRKGTYAGKLSLRDAEGELASVPIEVLVYGFDLPKHMTCQTAFGVRVGNIWRYQHVSEAAQRRKLLGKYWRDFGEHHISPYDPAPLSPLQVSWPGLQDWEGGQRDTTHHASGAASLLLRDRNPRGHVSARYAKPISIPAGGLRLTFKYKTETPGHPAIVTLNHHDAKGRWLSGRNNDMRFEGDGTWQTFERTITRFPKEARSVHLTLWPTLYAEDGSTLGTVWYDDVRLTDAGTGALLTRGGGFEPVSADRIVPRFEWTEWDGAIERGRSLYGFNTFRMTVPGLGGGTFHARYEPRLLGYGESTPEYRAALKAYLGKVEAHLRDKGWLDMAYVYWFDEPAPRDYAFVMNGFGKLKRYAPGLRRMLTEQVEDELIGGPNLWCPVSPQYNHERAEARRAQGDDFWWYICTGPKAPYCTLFIDHPATELRVWLWQTWKRKISGILVWETLYWTSPTAYPDPTQPQNPYEDPMSWVSGYDTPVGTKRPWGNGDGRFLYPPEPAACGSPATPVPDGPVDSIRWEMLRDGIEDYEYHAMLARLLEERHERLLPHGYNQYRALLEVPESITRDRTHFANDPAPIEARREALARAIETLSQL